MHVKPYLSFLGVANHPILSLFRQTGADQKFTVLAKKGATMTKKMPLKARASSSFAYSASINLNALIS